jgi:hypothetical protein
MKLRSGLLSAASSIALLCASGPARANNLIASVYGEYDTSGPGDLPSNVNGLPCNGSCGGDYDTPTLFFSNISGYSIINAQMVLSVGTAQNNGWNTLNNGASQTVSLGTLPNGYNSEINWGTGGSLFTYDYDDQYSQNYGSNPFFGNTPGTQNPGSFAADCTLNAPGVHPEWTQYCAPIGNFQVAFSGTLSGVGPLDGQPVASVFSEINVNGVYTGWEGVDPNGWSENATYDVHNGTVGGVLANIYTGFTNTVPQNSTPEPASLALLGSGLGALAISRRRRKS